MTTNESAQEEHEFISGMEHQPEPIAAAPGYHDVTVTVLDSWTRRLWRADGFIHRMLESLSLLGDKVLSMADPERGAADYEERSYERGVRDAVKYAGPNMSGSVNGGSKILTALVALNTALLVGVGGWLLATVSRHDRELAVLECQLNPACSQAVVRGRP